MEERKFSPSVTFFIRLGLFELFFLTPLIFYGWATTFSMVKQTFAQLGCLCLILLLTFDLFRKKIILSLPSSTGIFILLFTIFMVLSFAWTGSFYASYLSMGIWGTYLCVYFITIATIKDKTWTKLLLIAVIGSGVIAALYSFFQFYGIELPIWKRLTGRMRLFSTFGNPNYLAGYIVATLHLEVLLFLTQKRKWKIIFLITIGVLYASLLITRTRGAWISLLISFLLVLMLLLLYRRNFFKKEKTSIIMLTTVAFFITLIFLTPNYLNRGKISIIERGASVINFKSSASQRFLIWNAAVQLIKEKPLLGWGVGTFGVYYPLAQGEFLSRQENKSFLPQANRSINAHNDYLQVWAETGIIGLFLFAMIIGTFYWRAFSFLRKNCRENSAIPCLYLIFFTGGITSFLIHALVSFPFHIIQNGMVFWLLLALSENIIVKKIKWDNNFKENLLSENTDKQLINENKPGKEPSSTLTLKFLRWAILLIVTGSVLYLSIWRIKIFMSDLHVKQAELFMESRLYVEAKWELEKAVKINPWNAQAYADLTQVYSYARDYEKVIEATRRAQVNWNIPNIHNRKAFAYLELGEINKAKKALSRCMFLYPNFSAGYINRGYISLLEGEKNLKRGKPKLAEEKLNESFLYYVQGKIWEPEFPLPERQLSFALYEAEEKIKDGEWSLKKLSPPFPFYSRKDYLIFILSPWVEPEKPFVINLLVCRKKDKTSPSTEDNFSLAVEVKKIEKTVWRKDISNLNLPANLPLIFKFKVKKGVPSGKYSIFASLSSNGKTLSCKEIEFQCISGGGKEKIKNPDKIVE